MSYKIGTLNNTVWLFRGLKEYYTSDMYLTVYEPLTPEEMLEEWPKIQASITKTLKEI
jgi:hypothetical protein